MHDADIRAQLEQERRIIEAAADGPWIWGAGDSCHESGYVVVSEDRTVNPTGDAAVCSIVADTPDDTDNAAFIVHARTALPVRNAQVEAVLALADEFDAEYPDGGTAAARRIRRAIEEAGK